MWIPEIIRARPATEFQLSWIVPAGAVPRDPSSFIPAAAGRDGVEAVALSAHAWTLTVPGQTSVYGFIRRDVDEAAALYLFPTGDRVELRLQCEPVQTHAAHAAGAAGVLAMAAAMWMVLGWTSGIVPALTVLVGFGLWTDATRTMGMRALELRLRRLLADLGQELWPDAPAEILPPSRT